MCLERFESYGLAPTANVAVKSEGVLPVPEVFGSNWVGLNDWKMVTQLFVPMGSALR